VIAIAEVTEHVGPTPLIPKLAVGHDHEPVHSISSKIHFNDVESSVLGLPSGRFPRDFFPKMLYPYLISRTFLITYLINWLSCKCASRLLVLGLVLMLSVDGVKTRARAALLTGATGSRGSLQCWYSCLFTTRQQSSRVSAARTRAQTRAVWTHRNGTRRFSTPVLRNFLRQPSRVHTLTTSLLNIQIDFLSVRHGASSDCLWRKCSQGNGRIYWITSHGQPIRCDPPACRLVVRLTIRHHCVT
jgi:hypothetical protein